VELDPLLQLEFRLAWRSPWPTEPAGRWTLAGHSSSPLSCVARENHKKKYTEPVGTGDHI
jgi:hypothetical protein